MSVILSVKTARVKALDFHPTQPLLIAALHNGTVQVWNHETKARVSEVQVSNAPLRAIKYISRENWFIVGGDAKELKVSSEDGSREIKTIVEAHADYIRCIVVHPTEPLVLSASDDFKIKLWDWGNEWANTRVFDGHAHYVMQIAFNPRDPTVFASAGLDKVAKVWSLNSDAAKLSLEGHGKGVNAVSFADNVSDSGKSLVLTGADDNTVKVWDAATGTCIKTLEGHSNNVTLVASHPVLPVIISGSEDGTIRFVNSVTYGLEAEVKENQDFKRVWAVASSVEQNLVAFGFDGGLLVTKLGRDDSFAGLNDNQFGVSL
ncbi:UNVERIFIED_CONTAM: Coatomer subunit beta' [Siphonaria sp. JEL0065]|nr:Coatomer subunit beta' [Siphonaria sp. JEL0065]